MDEPEETLKQYIGGDRYLIKSGQPASVKRVGQLESAIKCTLPRELKDFYFQFGRIQGMIESGDFDINFYSVEKLLKCLGKDPPKYE